MSAGNSTPDARKDDDAAVSSQAHYLQAAADNTLGWTSCWDESSQRYYYWNTLTDAVTWENPLAGGADLATVGGSPSSALMARTSDWAQAVSVSSSSVSNVTARASSMTTVAALSDHFSHSAKGLRQMSHYFDVDAYQEEVNARRKQNGGSIKLKKKLTRRDIEQFKAKKEQKKKARLLDKFTD